MTKSRLDLDTCHSVSSVPRLVDFNSLPWPLLTCTLSSEVQLLHERETNFKSYQLQRVYTYDASVHVQQC